MHYESIPVRADILAYCRLGKHMWVLKSIVGYCNTCQPRYFLVDYSHNHFCLERCAQRPPLRRGFRWIIVIVRPFSTWRLANICSILGRRRCGHCAAAGLVQPSCCLWRQVRIQFGLRLQNWVLLQLAGILQLARIIRGGLRTWCKPLGPAPFVCRWRLHLVLLCHKIKDCLCC